MIPKKLILFLIVVSSVIYRNANAQIPLGIQASKEIICRGTSVTLFAIGAGSGLSWSPVVSSTQFITVTPIATTTYSLTYNGKTVTKTIYVCGSLNCVEDEYVGFNPFLLSTGNNGINTKKSKGERDDHWEVSTVSETGPYIKAYVSGDDIIPGNYSKSNWPNAQWIGASTDLKSTSTGNHISIYFRAKINLTIEEAKGLEINMQFMGDNTVLGVYVNNVLIPNSTTPGLVGGGFVIDKAATVEMKGLWKEGENTILVKIDDFGGFAGFLAQLNPLFKVPNVPSKLEVSPDQTICLGSSATLTASGGSGYAWTPNQFLNTSSGDVVVATPSSSLTYQVSADVTYTLIPTIIASGVNARVENVVPNNNSGGVIIINDGDCSTIKQETKNVTVTVVPKGSANCPVEIPCTGKSGANWNFGKNAAIHFEDDGMVTAKTGSMINTDEGCNTMSDINGNLLFYTNGILVFNKNNVEKISGLNGNPSATQSGLILPRPGYANQYYIITSSDGVKCQKWYTLIQYDTNDEIQIIGTKNTPIPNSIGTTEKLEAIRKQDGTGYWLIMVSNNDATCSSSSNVIIYSVDNLGVFYHSIASIPNYVRTYGYCKANLSGNQIALANYSGNVELLDFNNVTGIATYNSVLPISTPTGATRQFYGVQFSPNGKYLYVSDMGRNNTCRLYQYDLNDKTTSLIYEVRNDLANAYPEFAALQIAPNGKIYLAVSSYQSTLPIPYHNPRGKLSVINYPNEKGVACGFKFDEVDLGAGKSRSGLPNTPAFLINTPQILGKTDLLCNENIELTVNSGLLFKWSGPNGFLSTLSSISIPQAKEINAGEYTVNVTTSVGCTTNTSVNVKIAPCISNCKECISSFFPDAGQWYVLSVWVKEGENQGMQTSYLNAAFELNFKRAGLADSTTGTILATGQIIDGWQRVEKFFKVPTTATSVDISMKNLSTGSNVYFDDLRIHPLRANMKSFVYDPINLKLMAELDENNYATLYEYDHEGDLVRVKKETERGIVTIQEARDNSSKLTKTQIGK